MPFRPSILSLALLAACGGDPVSTDGAVTGPYEAVAFTTFEQGTPFDRMGSGSLIVVRLHPGGALSGSIFIPDLLGAGVDYDVALSGTWRRVGESILVNDAESTFLSHTPLEIRENGLLFGRYSGVGAAHPFGGVDSLRIEFLPRLE